MLGLQQEGDLQLSACLWAYCILSFLGLHSALSMSSGMRGLSSPGIYPPEPGKGHLEC